MLSELLLTVFVALLLKFKAWVILPDFELFEVASCLISKKSKLSFEFTHLENGWLLLSRLALL